MSSLAAWARVAVFLSVCLVFGEHGAGPDPAGALDPCIACFNFIGCY